MNALSGILLSTALLATAGCAQMRPAEPMAREASAAAPAAEPAILRGEEAPPLPERIPAPAGRGPNGLSDVPLSQGASGKPQTPTPRERAMRSSATYSNGASGSASAHPRSSR